MDLGARAALSAAAARGQRGGARHVPGRRQHPAASGRAGALLKAAPLSRSAVSRIVGTLRGSLERWQQRPLAELDLVYLYLDALTLRVRSAGQVVGVPVLAVVAVLADGQKQLVALELCSDGESFEAWKGGLDDLVS
jgi:transposase-like protein